MGYNNNKMSIIIRIDEVYIPNSFNNLDNNTIKQPG